MRIKAFRKTSVSIFGKSGGLFERQVRKMACHFAPPSEFRTPQKYQLRFSLRKRPMRRALWYFLSAQKVRKKMVSFRWSDSDVKSRKNNIFSFNS